MRAVPSLRERDARGLVYESIVLFVFRCHGQHKGGTHSHSGKGGLLEGKTGGLKGITVCTGFMQMRLLSLMVFFVKMPHAALPQAA